jgi:membrane-bound lytic murein transglycosylase F
MRFGPPYQHVTQQVVYRYGEGRPRDPGELVGGRIEIIAGSSHAEQMRRVRAEYPELEWIENPDAESEELLFRVSEGTIDFTVADSNELQLNQRYYPEVRAAFDLTDPEPLAWALAPGADTSLLEAVQAFFDRLREDGDLDLLLERFYADTGQFDFVGTRVFLRHINLRLPRYEGMFREAAAEVGVDWRLLAAIGYQESHWNPRAVSPTGVRGIMMLTLRTAGDLGVSNRIDPEQSIFGGARYFSQVHARVPEHIPEPDRTWMALAAYNVGYYHLMDARILTERKGANPDRWMDVREHLPLLSQRKYYTQTRFGYARGREPVIYVDNIRRYYDILTWMMPRNGNDVDEEKEEEAEVVTERVSETPYG